jgi:hypothetical protein
MITMPFSPGPRGIALRVDDLDVPPGKGDTGRARLDREHGDAVGVAEDRAAGLGLPHVVDDGDAIGQHLALEPLPGRRVEDLAGAHHPGHRCQVEPGGHLLAIAHEEADGGGGGEHAADDVLFDDLVEGLRTGMVDGTLEGDGGRPHQEGGVDDVAVADDPADVRRRPPHVIGREVHDPLAGGVDPHLVATVHVDGQLGRRRRS